MTFHTLAEFVATIAIVLIASGSGLGGMFLYFRLRERELDGQTEVRLRSMEMRLGAIEDAIGALAAGVAQPLLDATAATSDRTTR